MAISVVSLFSIGIGPSSSHTVGPMRAALDFIALLEEFPAHVDVVLRGSLASTGFGHGTDRAALLGLVGWSPRTIPDDLEPPLGTVFPEKGTISGPSGEISYTLTFNPEPVPEHPNCIIFSAYDAQGKALLENFEYFSVGGGFILNRQEMEAQLAEEAGLPAGAALPDAIAENSPVLPYPFDTGAELISQCAATGLSVSDIMIANETALHGSIEPVYAHLDLVWETMQECVNTGLRTAGRLPGGLNVMRRAPEMYQLLKNTPEDTDFQGLQAMEWVNLYALAVNEQNAAGGRIVTAPTNGAAGIIPAVLHYARDFFPHFDQDSARRFLLTAGAIGIIIKTNASISGAEVGCQGEVGSACAMAAGGLCALMGGNSVQIDSAAEIALEHNLGLTCDPVGGLVQIPCIERNAIGATKAINAARLSRVSSGHRRVTLDHAVKTMAVTGKDMLNKYKETSLGGLAVTLGLPVNLTEC